MISALNRRASRVFYGWWIVAFGSLINCIGGGICYHSFTVFFLPLKRDLEVSSAAISLIYGASRIEGGIEGPVVGYLIDRFGPRALILAGATLAGVGFILLSRANSFLAVALTYVLVVSLGFNAGFFHPVSAAVNSWFIRHRGITLAIIVAGGNLGGALMAPFLSHVILDSGWRTAAVLSGIVILATALPASLVMHRSPETRGVLPDGGPQPNRVGRERRPVAIVSDADFKVRDALKTTAYWLLTSATTLRLVVTVALAAHLVPIAVWKGMSEAGAAYLVSVSTFAAIPAALLLGWVGDRWNKRWLCSVGIMATVAGMLSLVVTHTTAALYFLAVGIALTMGTTPLNWALVGDFFGRRSYATLRGVMGTVYGIATFVSPVYAGWVFDRTGSYSVVLVSFAVLLVIAAALFLAMSPPPQGKTGSPQSQTLTTNH